jgi:hypothetical protein
VLERLLGSIPKADVLDGNLGSVIRIVIGMRAKMEFVRSNMQHAF